LGGASGVSVKRNAILGVRGVVVAPTPTWRAGVRGIVRTAFMAPSMDLERQRGNGWRVTNQ
jgi:hypothetical protein